MTNIEALIEEIHCHTMAPSSEIVSFIEKHTKGMALVPVEHLTPKGEPMPQTIQAWQRLYSLAESTMLADKAEIANLKMKINQLEQGK